MESLLKHKASRIVSLMLALVFAGTVLLGDVSQALAQHDDIVYPPAPFVYDQSVQLNKNYLVPKVNNGMTAAKALPGKVVTTAKAVPGTVVSQAKNLGTTLKTVPKAVGKVPPKVKSWYNKTTAVPRAQQGMSYWQRLRYNMGKGVQGFGKKIQGTNRSTTAKTAAASKTAASKTASSTINQASKLNAMKQLGISQDARGVYHQKGTSGALSRANAEKMINKYATKNPVKDTLASKAGRGLQSAKTKLGSGMSKFRSDLKAGYASGKANAGNIAKQTLDFRGKTAWRNVGLAAAMVVGVNTIRNVANGTPLTFQNTIGTVLRREFAGAYIGGALGCAGGALAQGVMSAVPVVGPIVGAFMPALGGILGANIGGSLAGQTRQGKFSFKDALAQIDMVEVGGQAIGSTIGAIIGSAICPGIGTVIGGMVGAFAGGAVANWVGGIFGRDKKDGTSSWLYVDDNVGTKNYDQNQSKKDTDDIDAKKVTTENATKAYQEYIAAYNKLTDLMSQGKGDTPEARKAYQEYKQAKERYEQIAKALK